MWSAKRHLGVVARHAQQVIRVHGDVIDDKMKLKIENGSQRQEKVIAWTKDTYGPYGPEMILSRNPIKPGEVRTIKTFIPDLNKIGITTLSARGMEPNGSGSICGSLHYIIAGGSSAVG